VNHELLNCFSPTRAGHCFPQPAKTVIGGDPVQPPTFDPWAWRDPSALAGGYARTTSDAAPPDGQKGAGNGPDAPGPGTPVDLVGYRVEATDGRIGSVDEASDDTDARWLVVDTGPWIFGRRRGTGSATTTGRPTGRAESVGTATRTRSGPDRLR
jgi:hypothetical protein